MAIVLSPAIISDVIPEITIDEEGYYLAMRAQDDNRTIPSRHFHYKNAKHNLFYMNNLHKKSTAGLTLNTCLTMLRDLNVILTEAPRTVLLNIILLYPLGDGATIR
jgi:hypothetical protein